MFLSRRKNHPASTQIQWLKPDSSYYWQVEGISEHLSPIDQYHFPLPASDDSQEHIAAITLRGCVILSGRLALIPSGCNKNYYHISRVVAIKFYSETMLYNLLNALIEGAKNLDANGLMVHVNMRSVATYLRLGFTKVVEIYDHIERPPLQKMFLQLE